MKERPLILVIDDDRDTVTPLIADDVDARILDPEDAGFNDDVSEFIAKSDLILVDQELDLGAGRWLEAPDGASLVGHFRSFARKNNINLAPLVLITNLVEAYAKEIPAVGPQVPLGGAFNGREHRLAPTLDVEWILAKNDPHAFSKISQLAAAYIASKEAVGTDGASFDDIQTFLKLPLKAPWYVSGKEYLSRARPPVSEDETAGEENLRGPSVLVRWLLQRALPYPGLFLSDLHASWSLRVTAESFVSFLSSATESEWSKLFVDARYSGPLSSFQNARWWASGIDYAAWQLQEKANELGDLQNAVNHLTGGKHLEILPANDSVVVWTPDFEERGIVPIEEAIQVHPVGWPIEAIEPWLLRSEVEASPLLQSMVDAMDALASSDESSA